ncbi:hypothetical protein I2I05_03445 [Hymenobacter sp. BT683]|uniref:Lipoprotein n=1 Tax=Hymenobacter jeongseonensis TaxID=2791027 RepID=A0ABS0IE24_9BACT|nr:hypothetical protein [Hymenobacter jeongseonensis]MBF9236442.1 hypothetical protein [Hymenobacter jeongseonensis]
MKQIHLSLLAAALVFSACESQSSTKTTTENATEIAEEPAKEASAKTGLTALDQAMEKMDALKVLQPLGNDEMTKQLPAELAGLKRGEVSLSETMGKIVQASYAKQPDGAGFNVAITDCAGELGAGKYLMAYVTPMSAEDSPAATPENEKLTTQKKVPFAGQQALSRHDPVNDVYSVVFMSKERLFVDVAGAGGTSLAEVLNFADKLNAQL